MEAEDQNYHEEKKHYQLDNDDQEQDEQQQDQEYDRNDGQDQFEQINYINQNRPTFPGAELPLENHQQYQAQGNLGFSSFTDEEVANLREIFNLFDKEQGGYIDIRDLETIMGSLQRDPSEVREFVENVDPNSNGRIAFDEFLNLMQQVENKIVKSGENQKQMSANDGDLQKDPARAGVINITADTKVLDFLRLLEEYRRKCEEQGNYGEARKSRSKFEELLKKETQRQKNNIRAAQE